VTIQKGEKVLELDTNAIAIRVQNGRHDIGVADFGRLVNR
jgi:hypothetical protein